MPSQRRSSARRGQGGGQAAPSSSGVTARVLEALRQAAARRFGTEPGLVARRLAQRTGYSKDAIARLRLGTRYSLRVVQQLDEALSPELEPADRTALVAAYELAGLERVS